MASDIDHVIDASHDVDITIRINETSIAGVVVARNVVHVGVEESLIVVEESQEVARRKGELNGELAHSPVGDWLVVVVENLQIITRTRPEGAPVFDWEDAFDSNLIGYGETSMGARETERNSPQIGHPVSVCHQLSITGTLRLRSAH
jgi:hypothetical protein